MTDRAAGPPVWVTILAGGVGRRFWPLSTPERPKQLLALGGARPLVASTLARVGDLAPPRRIRVLCGGDLVRPVREATGLRREHFLVEPRPLGTGPVLVRAAWEAHRRDPLAALISLHADHVIRPADRFRRTLRAAVRVAVRENLLMTVAVPPDRPETGYGYIRPGSEIAAPGGRRAFRVDSFVEKPDAETAARYVAAGHRWNSGIFVWPARLLLDEARRVMPEIRDALPCLEAGDVDGFFEAARPISVDEGILERSDRVGSIDADFEWDDMGSWEALARHSGADERGNVADGAVELLASDGNLAVADSGRLVLVGVSDLLVVRTADVTLVMPRSESPRLKEHLERLAERRDSGGPR